MSTACSYRVDRSDSARVDYLARQHPRCPINIYIAAGRAATRFYSLTRTDTHSHHTSVKVITLDMSLCGHTNTRASRAMARASAGSGTARTKRLKPKDINTRARLPLHTIILLHVVRSRAALEPVVPLVVALERGLITWHPSAHHSPHRTAQHHHHGRASDQPKYSR